MAGIKGPAVFLAQFLRDTPPFNSLENICKWFAELGYAGVQIPGWDKRVIDIDLAATSAAYCDELKGKLAALGLSITEIPAYLDLSCVPLARISRV
jgi:sugar phosphate isomerase/epimerase